MTSPTPGRAGSWLLRPPGADGPVRLFCLPYSGVGASTYARWPQRIGPAEVCLVQPPGRENRFGEPHYGSYEVFAERLAAELRPYSNRPYAFFGHCSSALVGYATTLKLLADGQPPPARLFVSSQVAPHDGPHGRFLAMTDAELAVELSGLTRAMGGEPDPDLVELGLRVLRADVDANKAYRLAAPVRVPAAITVLGWTEDVEVPAELMTGWRDYADEVRFVTVPGAHHDFLHAPLPLRAELAHDLDAAVRTAVRR